MADTRYVTFLTRDVALIKALEERYYVQGLGWASDARRAKKLLEVPGRTGEDIIIVDPLVLPDFEDGVIPNGYLVVALGGGGDDDLPLDATPETVARRLNLLPRPRHGSRVISVFSGGAGGVGKSTISQNLGYLCSREERTILIDVDTIAGDIRWYLGVMSDPPAPGIYQLLRADDWQEQPLSEFVYSVNDNFHCLLGPAELRDDVHDVITGEKLVQLLRRLRKEYDTIIVDYAGDTNLLADGLPESNVGLLVADTRLGTQKWAKEYVADLQNAMLDGRCFVVLNKASSADVVPTESIIGLKVLAVIGQDLNVDEIQQDRGFVVADKRGGRVAEGLRQLHRKLDELRDGGAVGSDAQLRAA